MDIIWEINSSFVSLVSFLFIKCRIIIFIKICPKGFDSNLVFSAMLEILDINSNKNGTLLKKIYTLSNSKCK